MPDIKHKVDQQKAGAVHSEVPEMRSTGEFDISQMSVETRAAWDKVCKTGGATPEDYKHVFASIMSSGVVDGILK